MRVLLTGSNGQVGFCLKEQLTDEKAATLLALDKTQLDITNREAVNAVVNKFKPTIIINAAAYTAVDKAEDDVEQCFAINRDGPLYLAQAAQRIDASILHISTDYVFEGNKLNEYVESDSTNPQGVYGESKLAGELAVAEACHKHIILRTAWVFGENGNNFVKTMLRLGAMREKLSVVGDQFGGPTYAGDIAHALLCIAKKITQETQIKYGIYHYSGLPHVSWCEFAEVIFNNAMHQGYLSNNIELESITTDQYPTPARRPNNSRLNTSKIYKHFSITASDWKKVLNNLAAYTG
ncbi:dTDP-4-dehydrorhamnose reductase [Parashewanella spongiae]|uniref:dTDP-4-dehydrorhamnose reductase n=1 Tax=Parashewanella spongiae TaxID=342950 RepID=A0A3A6UGZ3_9GAMM|nr:dTDP-4-dehydrorhamnose reductase [Parashewanella spongiae]MCL1077680.1 dTDP-4-dehydrorhamnose reductase [Parashewanella spongiae]RJY18235.1 dTDP-4-dehydrorhamnose reductase [Parashewanella spongiae]